MRKESCTGTESIKQTIPVFKSGPNPESKNHANEADKIQVKPQNTGGSYTQETQESLNTEDAKTI